LTGAGAARSEAEAFDAFAGALQRGVGAFADRIGFRRAPAVDQLVGGRGLYHGAVPFPLHDRHGTAVIAVALQLHYLPLLVSAAPRRWEIRTVQYVYRVHSVQEPRGQIAGYHWHPRIEDMAYAHCHAYAAPADTSRLHLPTGFITPRELFTWLMRDFGVAPIATDWQRALTDVDEALRASLAWVTPNP
jgi:hypothetical protein